MVDPRPNLVQLNGSNFPTWKIQIRMVLMKHGLWKIVNGTEVAPDENNVVAFNKFSDRRDRALSTLVLAVEPSLLYLLGDPEDPVIVWKKLCDQFQKKTWSNKLVLKRKLMSVKPRENESIQSYFKEMLETFEALSVMGEPVEEEERVVHILASLGMLEKYSMIVTAFEACPEVPKLEVVTEKLLNEERKMIERSQGYFGNKAQSPSHDALLVNSDNKPKHSGPPTCFYCGKSGHKIRFCEKKKQDEQEEEQKAKRRPEVANFSYVRNTSDEIDSDSSGDDLECIALINEVSKEKKSKWVIDSAATEHMCHNRKQIQNLRKLKTKKNVKVGNGSYARSQFEGTVKMRVRSGNKVRMFKLSNVLYVPELKYNLLSVSMASRAGKKVQFDNNGCEIIDASSSMVVGTGTRVGNLYYIDMASKSEQQKETNRTVSKNEMEKAIASIKENNFRQEIMERMNSFEVHTNQISERLSSVEGDIVSSIPTIKEEIFSQNQEDIQETDTEEEEESELEEEEEESESEEEESELPGELMEDNDYEKNMDSKVSSNNADRDGVLIQEDLQKETDNEEDLQGKIDTQEDHIESIRSKGVFGTNVKSKLKALKKRCAKFVRK